MRNHTIADALMPRTAQRQNDTELRRAAENRPVLAGFVSGNQMQKDAERAELVQLMAEFRRRGGKIEVLGQTALRPAKTRRQVTVDEAVARIAAAAPGACREPVRPAKAAKASRSRARSKRPEGHVDN